MSEISAMINAERNSIFAELQELREDQWSVVTACEPWTVRHVVAHMTAVGSSNAYRFFGGLMRSGFNFNAFTARGVEKYDQGSTADVLAGFGATLESPKGPPAPKYILLGEIMCHSEDIRRAVGEPGQHREEHLVTLAGNYRLAPAPIRGKQRTEGLRFTATDISWNAGDGPEVSGPAMDLILAMTGRVDALDTCTGDGVETLRSRC